MVLADLTDLLGHSRQIIGMHDLSSVQYTEAA
jgi:hypothetical protein